MGISQGLALEQKQKMLQRLSPQQMLLVNLYEMPITELSEEVKNKIYDNEALEEGTVGHSVETSSDSDFGTDESVETDEFVAPETYDTGILGDSEDEGGGGSRGYDDKSQEMPIGQTVTFLDDLWSQVAN